MQRRCARCGALLNTFDTYPQTWWTLVHAEDLLRSLGLEVLMQLTPEPVRRRYVASLKSALPLSHA